MTEIRENGFSVDLPGAWEAVDTEEPGTLLYCETAGSGILTVMLLSVAPVYAIADQRRLLSDYAQHRSKYEAGEDPTLVQSEPVFEAGGSAVVGVWEGVDAEAGRLRRHRAILAKGVLADFCYDAGGLGAAEFDARASQILGSATVAPHLEG